MNSLFNKHRWMQLMWGILLFVAGAVTIIFAVSNEGANVSLALSIAIALILFAYGFTIVFSSFLELKDGFFKYEIIIGAFVIAVGIVFCLNISLLQDIIVSLIASSLLVFGTVFAARVVMAFVKKMKVWWMGLCIVIAVLFLAAGVLCLVFRKDVVNICYFVLGAILVIVGIIEIYITIKRAIEANKIGIEQKEYGTKEKVKNPAKEKKNKKEKEPVESTPKSDVVDVDVTVSEDEEKNEVAVIEEK